MTGDDDKSAFDLSTPLAAAAALAVGALAAVGVSGDLLARAVRNHPTRMAVAVLLVVIPAGLIVVSGAWRRFGKAAGLLAVLALIGVSWVISSGATSLRERNRPTVALSTSTNDAGVWTITVDASAAGVPSYDDMLVQVLALNVLNGDPELGEACTRSRIASPPEEDEGSLLAWQRAGPDSNGDIEFSASFEYTGTHQGLCAYASLRRDENEPDHWAVSYLRLTSEP